MGSADVEALDRSFRSRVLLLGLLCVGGVGLAIWEYTRDVGRGATEDPRRVLIVTPEQRSGDDVYLRLFDRAGFVAEVDGLVSLEQRAHEYVADSDAQGLALVLEFADLGGYGFVVVERPGELDFGGIETDPPIADIDAFEQRDYAVLSVGDLAFPHRLSVDEIGEDPLLRMRGHGALQAIFRQPRLDPEREVLVERPTVDELKLEDAIERGRRLVVAPEQFPQRVEQVLGEQREALDERNARALLEPLQTASPVPNLQTGSPLPIAGGGALLLRHPLNIYSDDALTLELDAGEWLHIDYLDPAALASGATPQPCTAIHEGKIRLDRQPSFEIAADARALAITAEREGSRLWKYTPRVSRGSEPECSFTELGELPPLAPGESHFGKLAPTPPPGPDPLADLAVERPILARVQHFLDGEGSRLRVFSSSEQVFAPLPRTLLELDGIALHHPIFLDARRLALLGSPAAPDDDALDDYLYVVDTRTPGTFLRIPADFLHEGWQLRDLAWLPSASGPWNLALVVHARDPLGRSHLVELSLVPDVAAELDLALAGQPPTSSPPASEPTTSAPGLLTISPEQLVVRELLAEPTTMLDFAVAPDGHELALVLVNGKDSELALLDRASGGLRWVTDNQVKDYLPRYTSAGQLLFSSLVQVTISRHAFTVPRLIVRRS